MHCIYNISLSTISQLLFTPPGSEPHESIPVSGRKLVHVPPHVLAVLRVLGSIVLLAWVRYQYYGIISTGQSEIGIGGGLGRLILSRGDNSETACFW